MSAELEVLPRFLIHSIVCGDENTWVDGAFSRPDAAALGDRGWLFVCETESTIADVASLSDDVARLDVSNWSMTAHVHVGADLPWLDAHRWNARDVAFLVDPTKKWEQVTYQPTDMVEFAQAVLRCPRCGWTGDPATKIDKCPKCTAALNRSEIFGNQEAAFPLDDSRRFIEVHPRAWDHDHCLICDAAIGRSVPDGYRESSFVGGPNSVGLWICVKCFERYLRNRDFSFLVSHLA